ncbi:MAG: CerR family C-terminal domain-containing protein [Vicinamibacterales bacterium]
MHLKEQATTADGPAAPDAHTRQRLLDVATALFAERGFKKVTVRDLCKAAQANVAAVNYHFGDKQGLYDAVVGRAIAVMRETNELGIAAGEGLDGEGKIEAFVRVFFTRVRGTDRLPWIHKLVTREFEEPTGALDAVLTEVVQPRIDYLADIVAGLLDREPADPVVQRLVVSIQSQVLMYARPIPRKHMPPQWAALIEDLDEVVRHIMKFSMAGIAAYRS